MKIQWIYLVIIFGALIPISLKAEEKEIQVIEGQKKVLGCENFETYFWDALDAYLVSEKKIPNFSILKDQILKAEKQGQISKLTKEAWVQLQEILFEEAPQKQILENAVQLRMFFAAMEVGDESTEGRKELKTKIFSKLKELKASVPEKKCAFELEAKIVPKAFLQPHPTRSIAEIGMRWLFSTAYQSCEAVRLPAMTEKTSDVRGIQNQGAHVDGVGHQRKIDQLEAFLSSHYYYTTIAEFKSRKNNQCVKEKEVPLIYDYGGKPFSEDGLESTLDLFTNDGTGTEALGIDCAAAVFTATATAGLLLKPGTPLRARNVLGVNSRMFKDPVRNGLECFETIRLSKNSLIRSGDIAAVNGHVLMIGEVGKDPFGLSPFKQKNDCASVSAELFNFKIWQSGSQKGGIGLHYIEAKAYLKEAKKMRDGFEEYAKAACEAQLEKKEVEPQLDKFAVIRHKNTKNCQAQRIALKGEECIQNCRKIF